MPVSFFKEKVRFTFRDKEKITSWILSAIRKHGAKPGQINIVFCTDPYLRKLNKSFLNHDYNTDILTFPGEEDAAGVSGEIYISVDRVKVNAGIYKVEFCDELHRVLIHGILHLLGYEDASEKQKKEMRAVEDYWLEKRNF